MQWQGQQRKTITDWKEEEDRMTSLMSLLVVLPHPISLSLIELVFFRSFPTAVRKDLILKSSPFICIHWKTRGGEWQHSIKSSFCFCYEAPTYNWRRSSAVLYENCPINGNDCSADLKYWHFPHFTTQAGEPWVVFLKTFPETETSAAGHTSYTHLAHLPCSTPNGKVFSYNNTDTEYEEKHVFFFRSRKSGTVNFAVRIRENLEET